MAAVAVAGALHGAALTPLRLSVANATREDAWELVPPSGTDKAGTEATAVAVAHAAPKTPLPLAELVGDEYVETEREEEKDELREDEDEEEGEANAAGVEDSVLSRGAAVRSRASWQIAA